MNDAETLILDVVAYLLGYGFRLHPTPVDRQDHICRFFGAPATLSCCVGSSLITLITDNLAE